MENYSFYEEDVRRKTEADTMVEPNKILLAFDFDHTIVDGNSDTWITGCLPDPLPVTLKQDYIKGQWTNYMRKVLAYLNDSGVTVGKLKARLKEMQLVEGMAELLCWLASEHDRFDVILVSDSNSLFIDWILQRVDLQHVFGHIFTNPATVDACGHVLLKPHHSHSCSRCPVNLCKGQVLREYVASQPCCFSSIVYVGDGANDLCPVLSLSCKDAVLPRKGYSLMRWIKELLSEDSTNVLPHIVPWDTGFEILQFLQRITGTT
uniref:pyridoxal phosphate phosphatase PHOSPHO2-like isoform X1 n=1 Tax=Myxine glutinosa TaxID=7769 RepID=UPI00358F9FE1